MAPSTLRVWASTTLGTGRVMTSTGRGSSKSTHCKSTVSDAFCVFKEISRAEHDTEKIVIIKFDSLSKNSYMHGDK